jgi:hypothetical protein
LDSLAHDPIGLRHLGDLCAHLALAVGPLVDRVAA